MKFNNKSGQAAVEYLLLVAAMSIIIFSLSQRVRDYFLADAQNCNASSKSLTCALQKILSREDGFRTFRMY